MEINTVQKTFLKLLKINADFSGFQGVKFTVFLTPVYFTLKN